MNFINEVLFVGIVESLSESLVDEVTRPIVRLTSYNSVKKDWNKNIPVLIENDNTIRQLQSMVPGDILLVEGCASSIKDFGNCIIAEDIVELSKNKGNSDMSFRKITLFDSGNLINVSIFKGNVVSLSKDKKNVKICLERKHAKRNSLKKFDTLSAFIFNDVPVEQGDTVIFSGKVADNGIMFGEIEIIKKGDPE